MPWQTQMQQSVGTNRGAPPNAMQAATAPQMAGGFPPPPPPPVPGVDPAWSRMFGSQTPNALLDRRAAGEPLSPSATPTAGTAAGGNGGAAGANNAIAPGSVAPGSDPNNGWSNAKEHGGESNQSEGATAMQAATAPPPPVPPSNMSPDQMAAWAAKEKARIDGTPPVPAPVAPPPVPMPQPMLTKPLRPGQPGQPPVAPNAMQAATAPAPGAMSPGGNPNFDESTGTYKPGTGPTPPSAAAPAVQPPFAKSAPAPQTPMQAATAPQAMAAGETQDAGQEAAAPAAAAGETATVAQEPAAPAAPPAASTTPWKDDTRSFEQMFGQKKPGAWEGWTPKQKQTYMTNHYQAPAAGEAGTEAARTFHFGSVNYTSTHRQPADWATRTDDQRQAWLDKYATPSSTIQSTAQQALMSTPFGKNLINNKHYLPETVPTGAGGVAADGMSPADILKMAGGDSQLAKLITAAIEVRVKAGQPTTAGDARSVADQNDAARLSTSYQAALAPYGITLGDTASFPADPNAPPPDPNAPPPVVPPGGDSGPHTGDPTFPNTNTDRSDLGPGDVQRTREQQINHYISQGMSIDQAMMMLQLDSQAAGVQNQRNDYQSGLNILANASGDAETREAPIRDRALTITQDMLDNPDPVNYDLLRNKAATDSDRQTNEIVQNISKNSARRGLSAGAVQGYQGRILGDQANALSSRLGDIDIRQSQGKRAGQLEALNAGANTMQTYIGGDYERAGRLAAFTAGQINTGNPYNGAGDAQNSIDATAAARAQEEDAGKTDWTAYGMIAAGVVGAFFTGGATLGVAAAGAQRLSAAQ